MNRRTFLSSAAAAMAAAFCPIRAVVEAQGAAVVMIRRADVMRFEESGRIVRILTGRYESAVPLPNWIGNHCGSWFTPDEAKENGWRIAARHFALSEDKRRLDYEIHFEELPCVS